MMYSFTCPACSSTNVETNRVTDTLSDKFGNGIEFFVIENTCLDCESTGDFDKLNDPLLSMKVKELNKLTIQTILEIIKVCGYKDPVVELKLHLDYGTLKVWRENPSLVSIEGLALLKILGKNTYFLDW